MIFKFKLRGRDFEYNSTRFSDLSISLLFNGPQPNPFGVEKAIAKPYQGNGLIGDTRLGGSCNFDVIQMIPHCNGTHTECIGHISDQRMHIREQLKEVLIPATLVSIDTSHDAGMSGLMISKEKIQNVLSDVLPGFERALVIRTRKNENSKKWNYSSGSPIPFMSKESIAFLNEQGVEHLLVDFPSIDPLNDQGRLEAHREFWNMGEGSHMINKDTYVNKTITELIYVPDDLADGSYLLNLQIAPFASDASPSRPILFPLVTIQN